jgi:hypothetical protein
MSPGRSFEEWRRAWALGRAWTAGLCLLSLGSGIAGEALLVGRPVSLRPQSHTLRSAVLSEILSVCKTELKSTPRHQKIPKFFLAAHNVAFHVNTFTWFSLLPGELIPMRSRFFASGRSPPLV